jgi:hypothetical protein
VIEEVVEDEIVLLMPHAGAVLVLNDVGRTVWGLVDGRRTADEIAALVCAEYEVEPAQARADARAFLADLAARGLVAPA